MTAVQDFLESEWTENERAIAKQNAIRDLHTNLNGALKGISDAKERMETGYRSAPDVDGGLRIVIWVLSVVPWFYTIFLIMIFVIGVLTGRLNQPDLGGFAVLAFAIALIGAPCAAGTTPEMFFWIRERLRVTALRTQARTDFERLSNNAEELRRKIKSLKAED